MKILVAEDSPTVRAIVQFSLQSAGYEVVVAQDGIEAVKLTYAEMPDILVSDILMPRMNGYQVCRLLKDDALTSQIPIIIMTTLSAKSDKFWGIMSGADDYLTKPFEPQELLEMIEGIILKKNLKEKQKDSVEKIRITVDASQIISRVNNLLDRELFRSALINEVGGLTSSLQNYPIILKMILDLFSKVMNYETAGILVLWEDEEQLTITTKYKITREYIFEFERKLLRCYEEAQGKEFKLEKLKREIHTEETEKEQDRLTAFCPLFLERGPHPLAICGFASSSFSNFPPEDIELLNFLSHPLSIVLENALLHKNTSDMAITDGLTKLSTHRFFQESLDREISRSRRFGLTFALIILDIDNFKMLNDTYGHLEGDKVLVEIAKIMKQQTRDTDIVARYGGEEFVVILSETDKEGASITAQRIREKIEEHKFILQEKEVKVTASLGVAIYPYNAENKIELIRKADKALYRAKTTGKNRLYFADE